MDTELVIICNTGGTETTMIYRPTELPTYPFIVRRTDEGWRIANIGKFPD
jgi:hypothetical protein